MKSTQVKSHKRKGRVVKSHSRAVKGAMKNSGSGMSAEECKAKYDAMVAKYGEDSPQAKKLAMKMEGMETVEKDSRYPKGKVRASQEKISEIKKSTKPRTRNGKIPTKEELSKMENIASKARVRKHSRGDYMRKNVEEEFLTKESKAKKGSKVSPEIAKANQKDKVKKLFADKPVVGKKPSGEHKKAMHDKMAALRAKKK